VVVRRRSGPSDAELAVALVEVLARSTVPLAASAVRTALPPPFRRTPPLLAAALDALVAEGRAFGVPVGKGKVYSRRRPETLVAERVRDALRDGPLTLTELKSAVRTAAPGLEKLLSTALPALVEEKTVYVHPPPSKGKERYALAPLDPTPYVAKAVRELQAVLDKLGQHGVTVEAVAAAVLRGLGVGDSALPAQAVSPGAPAAASQAADRVLSAVDRLAAREPPGALLEVEEVRRIAGDLGKRAFDQAVLGLRASGIVILHHHDFPARLPPERRAALVEDENGTCYVGIARRRK